MIVTLLQSADDIQRIVTTDNATVQGILIGIVMAVSGATIYLFKENRRMQLERLAELKEFNEAILKINKQYDDFIRNFEKYKLQRDV